MSEANKVEMVENQYIQIWMEDDIVCGCYKKSALLGLEGAKAAVDLRLKFQNGKSYKGLAFITHVKVLTPEARKYLSEAGYIGVEKAAIIANSPIAILLGNLFILINKPPKPTKLFKDKEDAIKWLKK
jgi:hypothetical protein